MELLSLTVPKEKCILDFLAEMGEKTRNAWIFLHRSIIHDTKKMTGVEYFREKAGRISIFWTTEAESHKFAQVNCTYGEFDEWRIVTKISAEGVAFSSSATIENPDYIILLKSEGA